MNQLIVSLRAVGNNYRKLKTVINAGSSHCAAVVKADGYGLGAKMVIEKLAAAGCRKFFVATYEEGMNLPKDNQARKIFVFHGAQENELQGLQQRGLIPVINNKQQLKLWPKDLPCALHFDTGMTRLGLSEAEIDEAKTYNPILVMSHLACADEPQNPKNQQQLEAFKKIAAHFPTAEKSLSNSYGIFLGADYHFGLARPGIALYGGNPTPASANPMQPVVTLTAPILQIHEITKPQSVGYGADYSAEKGDIIATIPIGYADGILRTLGNKAVFHHGNHELPVVGRISMDLITIKINNLPPALRQLGVKVEILGEKYTITDMARDAGTIEYEIITWLGNRFERIYEL